MAPPQADHREVVIITGGSRGIGLEAARRFAGQDASVGLVARDAGALTSAAAALATERVHAAAADVAEPAPLSEAFDQIERRLGPPTVLVNCAGHGMWSPVIDTDLGTFRRAIDVNYLGVVNATSLVLEGMLERGRGHVVNVASIAGRIGAPFEAAYSASKFAVVGYSEALAIEIAGTGVHVSLIDPGPVDTEFFERRGRGYDGGPPRPIPAGRVADAIVDAVTHGGREQFLPRWLRLAHVIKTVAPPVHRFGVRRRFARERRQLRNRFR